MNGPKGTPMNGPKKGISLTTPGFPLDEAPKEPNQIGVSLGLSLNDAPKTFQTRKAEAMRKKGLNLKGNPLGSKLNSLGSKGNSLGHSLGHSLANRVKRRKEQALKNVQKNGQKNGQKSQTKKLKGRITERKMKELEARLEKAKQNREHDKALRELRKMEPKEDPEMILSREKKAESNRIGREYKADAEFDKLFGTRHDEQPTHMEGMDPEVAKELFKASRKSELSNYKAQMKLSTQNQSQPKPKSNTNIPDFKGKLST
jgi:hypothetical protein